MAVTKPKKWRDHYSCYEDRSPLCKRFPWACGIEPSIVFYRKMTHEQRVPGILWEETKHGISLSFNVRKVKQQYFDMRNKRATIENNWEEFAYTVIRRRRRRKKKVTPTLRTRPTSGSRSSTAGGEASATLTTSISLGIAFSSPKASPKHQEFLPLRRFCFINHESPLPTSISRNNHNILKKNCHQNRKLRKQINNNNDCIPIQRN